MIEVVDYDPEWKRAFEELRARIWPRVEGFAVAIEHVGSTSVPGLAAKPVIDLDIVVAHDGDVQKTIDALAELGYKHRGNLGIEGREAFARPADAAIPHNLYVCVEGAVAFRNHIAIRDYLRQNPEVAKEYGALKKELAEKFPDDIDSYIDGKTDFLVGILRTQGFEREHVEEIDRANRK
jgi:GrpB-like predicted nucleotidyltransferase (UPF0157 family)